MGCGHRPRPGPPQPRRTRRAIAPWWLHCHAGEHAHDGGGCHPIGTDTCPLGEHEHLTERTSGCHPTSIDHYPPKEPSYLASITKAVLADVLCGAAAAGATVGSAAGPAGATIGAGTAGTGCVALVATFETASDKRKLRMLKEAKRRHNKLVEDKNRKDRPSDSTMPSPTAPPTTAPPTDAQVDAALKRFLNGDIDKDQYNEIRRRRDCAQGWADACAALGQ